MTMSNKFYDRMKWIAQYLLPAIATLYAGLAKIWGFPYGTEVVGTISAIDIFLGAVLGISSNNYQGDGTLEIDQTGEDKDTYHLMLNDSVESLTNKTNVMFKVNTISDSHE